MVRSGSGRSSRQLLLLLLLVALGAGAVLWSSLPQPQGAPPQPQPQPQQPDSNLIAQHSQEAGAGALLESEVAGSAMPPPRQVTRSLSELGVNLLGAGRELSDHALLLNHLPRAGSELFALLLKWLQAINGFRLVPLPLTGWARSLSATKQEDLVVFVTATLRHEALPVAFHGHLFFTNFSRFDRQSPAYISIVRDPVDKAMSSWDFDYRFYNARAKTTRKGSNEEMMSTHFARCIEETWPECNPYQDLSVPYFCGQSPRCRDPNSNWALSRAKANIERYFPVVGVLEYLNATLTVLETQIPLFFTGVRELYQDNLLDPHLNWSYKRFQDFKPILREKLAYHFGSENDLYLWIKQRLMQQLNSAQQKTPLPGEAGQDRIAYSVHSKTHLIKL